MARDNPPPLSLITGGTSGIGYAVAEKLAQTGYDLIISGRDQERGWATAHSLASTFDIHCEFIALSNTDWTHYGTLIPLLQNRPLKVVVASAAIGLQAHLIDTPREEFDKLVQTNVVAPLYLVQTLAPYFHAPASVILISSDAGIEGEQELGAYSVTKSALNMMGRMLALDLSSRGVRVNVVCPGDTVPGMRYLVRPGEVERSTDDYLTWPVPPRGRLGQASDTAELVAFLASDRADFIVGSVMLVDGGSRAGRPDPRVKAQILHN
jgi:NAD(P)-dependent dehydrogenase (short-subunit alcohol dehydrogenase family)